MCAEVTPTCYPPDYPDPPTPAPVGAISDPPEVGNGSGEKSFETVGIARCGPLT